MTRRKVVVRGKTYIYDGDYERVTVYVTKQTVPFFNTLKKHKLNVNKFLNEKIREKAIELEGMDLT